MKNQDKLFEKCFWGTENNQNGIEKSRDFYGHFWIYKLNFTSGELFESVPKIYDKLKLGNKVKKRRNC